MTTQTVTFLSLPREIRQEIFRHIYWDITINVDRGLWNPPALEARDIREGIKKWRINDDYDQEHYDELRLRHDTSRPQDKHLYPQPKYENFLPPARRLAQDPRTPAEVINLRLVCSDFATDVTNHAWHTAVTYRFPSTVTLLDILSGWTQARLESVRHIYVFATRVRLNTGNKHQRFHGHLPDALKVFKGLKLDTLAVENCLVYYYCNGDPQAADETTIEFTRLLTSLGWKNLCYVSQAIHLSELACESTGTLIKAKCEADFTYHIQTSRPGLNRYGQEMKENQMESLMHQGLTKNFDLLYGFRDMQQYNLCPGWARKRTVVQARRGKGANYIETGDDRDHGQSLLQKITRDQTWLQIRQTRQYYNGDELDGADMLEYESMALLTRSKENL